MLEQYEKITSCARRVLFSKVWSCYFVGTKNYRVCWNLFKRGNSKSNRGSNSKIKRFVPIISKKNQIISSRSLACSDCWNLSSSQRDMMPRLKMKKIFPRLVNQAKFPSFKDSRWIFLIAFIKLRLTWLIVDHVDRSILRVKKSKHLTVFLVIWLS